MSIPFPLYTQHFTLFNLHFQVHISHCKSVTSYLTLYTFHFTFDTSHFTLLTVNLTLPISYLKHHRSHFTLQTLHFTLHNSHFAQWTLDTIHNTRYMVNSLHFAINPLQSHFTLTLGPYT